ncbi:MAG: fimbrial protein [Salaquimonas sp.]
MSGPQNNDKESFEEEKPLDPEMEKVRKKLVKFSSVFMGLNMVALMAVLGAIVYKIGGYGDDDTAPQTAAVTSASVPVEPGFEQAVDLPDGARILSASETNGRVLMNLVFRDGSKALWFYDINRGQITGKISVQ